MKLTRGQKNEIERQAWIERRKKIEELTGKKVVQTLKAGSESSWSYRPGGEGKGFESPESVVVYLEHEYSNKTLNQ